MLAVVAVRQGGHGITAPSWRERRRSRPDVSAVCLVRACWAGAHLSLASVLKCRLSVVPAVQGAFHIDTLEVTGGFFPNVIVILIMLVWTATANLAM